MTQRSGTWVFSRAKNATPVLIILKDPSQFPHQKQYPLRPEARVGLQPIISKFIFHGLLKPTSSHCNAPVLMVRKKDNSNRLVQDLRIINETVVPLHSVISNPYILLGIISTDSEWYCVRSEECILLHPPGPKVPSSFLLSNRNSLKGGSNN